MGRDPNGDLVLTDPQVSRRHATLWMESGRCFVRDEDSTNGTFVNERRIKGTKALHRGDKLRLGSTVFVLGKAQGVQSRAVQVGATASVVTGASFVAALLLVLVFVLARSPAPELFPAATSTTDPGPLVLTPISAPSRTDAQQATVLIDVPLAAHPDTSSRGSGSIIASEGLILTNFHVIGETDSGHLHNIAGPIYVALTTMPDGGAQWRYQAKPIVWDVNLDLAVLVIVSDYDGNLLNDTISLPTVRLGDSDTLQIGDQISILGYPDVGLDTLTVTGGTVSGFVLDEHERREWIKTDASVSLGNSGGLATNERGELIGVPTMLRTSLGQLGYVRPINWALPLIEKTR